ncbi:MAG: EAL domain-containing protein [Gemmatirosa sp.]
MVSNFLRRVGAPVAVLTAYVAAHFLWLATHWGGDARRVAIADAFLLPLFLWAAIASVRVARHAAVDPRVRRAWGWLAVSYATLWVANVIWTYRDLAPSAAVLGDVGEALVAASYLPLLAGLLSFPSAPRRRSERARFWLDLATVLVGAGLLVWWLVDARRAPGAPTALLDVMRELTVPVADFAILAALAALTIARIDAGSRFALRLLAAGHALCVTASLALIPLSRTQSVRPGDWIDGLWMLSAALMVSAADVELRRATRRGPVADPPTRARRAFEGHFSALPYAGVALGYALLLIETRAWWAQPLGIVALASGALTALVVARQVMAVRDNQRLVAERRAQDAYFRGLIEHAADVVYVVGLDGTLHYASASASRVFGYQDAGQAPGSVIDYLHPDDHPAAARALGAAAAAPAGESSSITMRVRHQDGVYRVVEAAVRRLPDTEGRFVLNVRDVTERVRAEAALSESQRALSTLLSNLPGMAYRCRNDEGWTMEFVSDGCAALTGYPAAELVRDGAHAPRRYSDLIHPDDLPRVRDVVEGAIRTTAPFQLGYRIRTAQGEERHVWEQGRAVVDPDSGEIRALEGIVLDVTERTRAEAEREELVAQRDAERALLAAVIEQMPAAVLIAEASTGRLVLGNGQVSRIFGDPTRRMTALEAYTERVGFHADGRPVAAHEWPLMRAIVGERVEGEEYRLPAVGRAAPWVRISAGPVRDREGTIVAGVAVAEDVTQRRGLEEQLAHQAFHDPLTGLANRALFRDRVEHALAQAGRSSDDLAVLFLDLDDFKSVNDSLGHAEGDQLLVQVAARLLNATRGSDTVARLGGDEFAVLLANAGGGDAHVVANRILSSLTRPVPLAARDIAVGASIGIATARTGETTEELLRNADLAMYQAKARGKGTYEEFAPPMYEAVRDRMSLGSDLHQALERREFRLVYQPVVDLATEAIVGVEALVRWHHPERGVVGPCAFIPLAEESGLILPLGRWVLGEACRQAAAWRRMGIEELRVAVNISGRQLEHPQLVADVASALGAAGLPPGALLLEITESVVMQDTEASLHRLHELKDIGVQLAIDDFGTGYSSLSYLQRFPVDVLKIDKSFVDGVADGGSHAALARTIIALGETLSLCTVAEGIETPEQGATLLALGCGTGQGYHYSRPRPADEITALVRAQRSPAAA